MIKICIVTGSRADYGLLRPIISELKSKTNVELQIIATGMHLSQEFGLTYREIEKDFKIDEKIEMLLSSDSKGAVSKSIGLGIIGFADAFSRLNPDAIILLGDRFEIFSAAISAMNQTIPIAHIHGGETGAGTIDNMIRHAITKMSSIHFVSTEKYRKRVIQLGESPESVYHVGAPGVENILKMDLMSKEDIEDALNFKIDEKTVLLTFHPLSLQEELVREQFECLLRSLSRIGGIRIIFTKANADTGGRIINEMIDQYVKQNETTSVAHASLGTLKYLSTLKYVKAVVGNSSSGIIEAPSLGTYTLDIGDRQKGRICGKSVIKCEIDEMAIVTKLRQIIDNKKYEYFENPYAKEDTSKNIVEILLKNVEEGFKRDKVFYDLEVLDGIKY